MCDDGNIRGIEIEIIEKILRMIQEKYPVFNKGTYYLAFKFGIDNDIGFHNLRDMLTHLKTTIVDCKDRKSREDQILLAEEHLRRALVEPYELGANETLAEAKNLFDEYDELIIKTKAKEKEFFPSAIDETIRHKFRDIQILMTSGREKKTANLWNNEWEKAVEAFTDAADKAFDLKDILKIRIEVLKRIHTDRRSKIYFIWAIVATIIVGLMGIFITLIVAS